MNNGLFYFRRQVFLAIVLLSITFLVSYIQHGTWKAEFYPSTSRIIPVNRPTPDPNESINQYSEKSIDPLVTTPANSFTPTPETSPTPQATSIPSILGADYDPSLDLHAGPVSLPIKLIIPDLKVDAPILGVGLTEDNDMDAPKGPYGDPNWSSVFWFRGSAIPGDPGTATLAGHVNGPGGEPETFAKIRKLKPGDLIIIKSKNPVIVLYFVVDEVKRYSISELNLPEIADRIFGGSVNYDEQRLTDGISHLALITCTGIYTDGEFDHRTVVFATLRE